MITQQNQTTFNNSLQNETLYINYCINNMLLNMYTMLPAQITAINGLLCTVQLIINTVGLNQPTPPPISVANVPICQLIGGSSGIIIEYQIGDVVLCGAIQRDISSIKNTWQQANPASQRKFSLSDIVVMFKLSNSLPTNFVKITDSGIEITAPDLPITVNGKNITVNDTGTTTLNADSVLLGTAATNSILLQGVEMTATIAGVQPGGGVSDVSITITAGGSSQVQATP